MAREIDDVLLSRKGWVHIYNELKEIYMATFKWEGLPESVNARYMEKYLLHGSQVAFYWDKLIEDFVCLSSTTVGKLDVYGDPVRSRVYGVNGYSVALDPEDHVVIWDNLSRHGVNYRLMQFAKRIWEMERTIDVNIAQQKTPRIIKATKDTELSVKTMLRDVDNYKEKIVVMDSFNEYNDVDAVLAPAPFVADKIRQEKRELWNEVLSFIGIENNSAEKKERLVADEVAVSNALAVIKRNSRMEARQQAIDKINAKWGLEIEVNVNQISLRGSFLEDLHERGVIEDGEVYGGTEDPGRI